MFREVLTFEKKYGHVRDDKRNPTEVSVAKTVAGVGRKKWRRPAKP